MRFLKQYSFLGLLVVVITLGYQQYPDFNILTSGKKLLVTLGFTKENTTNMATIISSNDKVPDEVFTGNNTIYKWQNEKGKWEYSNIPPAADKKAEIVRPKKQLGIISHIDLKEESQVQKIGNKISSYLTFNKMTPVTETMVGEAGSVPAE